MKRHFIFLAMSVIIVLSACSQNSQVPVKTDGSANVLGRLTVHISGIGSEVLSSTAHFTPSLSSQLTEDTSYTASDFTSRTAGTFIHAGMRYIDVFYTFPNKSSSAREIILVAVSDNGTVTDNGVQTPFRQIKDYDGNAITNNSVGLKMSEAKEFDLVTEELITSRYNSYVKDLDISGLNANQARGETILTEGFQAWNSNFSGRVIAAGANAKILFSTSFSRSVNNQISKDPFSFNIVFLVAEK